MIRGDSYTIPISLDVNIDEVSKVEFTFGTITKSYPTEVSYNSANRVFGFPLTQTETFSLPEGIIKWQARILYTNGDVIGTNIVKCSVEECLSEAELS